MIKDARMLFNDASGGPASGARPARRSGQAGLSYDLLLRAQEMVHVGAWAASIDAATSRVVGEVLLTDEMYRLLGLEPGSGPVTFDRFVAAIHDDDRARIQGLITGAIANRIPFRFDFRVATDDDRLKMVNVRANFEDNSRGDTVRLLGTAADVTDRYRAEQALSLTEMRLHAVFEQASVGMAVAEISGRLTQVNKSFADLLGYSVTELEGKTFLEITHPEDLATTVEHTFGNNHGKSVTFEKRYIRRDGVAVWAKVTVCRLNLRQASDSFMALIEDIDERRRNEGAMQLMQQRLAQTQTLEALGQLAGGVAHDFNNLLTVIGAGATFIEEAAEGDDVILSDARDIQAACSRATSLTRELLAFSRRQLLHPEVLDVNDIVRNLGTTLGRILGENVQLDVNCAAPSANVEVDRHQLEQVILNLAVNARDALADHGTVTLATRNTTGPDGRRGVLIEVGDDGAGIEPAVLHRIFEPFFTTKAIGKGAGLGLATVLGVVEQSGGRIDVESVIGKGTTFRVFLPIVDAMPVPRQRTPEQQDTVGHESVLLVEDESAVRAIARRMLTAMGYSVIEARHGRDALQLIDEGKATIDILVTDVVMPEMGGREVAAALRERIPALPVLFISGYTDDELLRRGVLEPGARLLRKPFSAGDLGKVMRSLLDRRPVSH